MAAVSTPGPGPNLDVPLAGTTVVYIEDDADVLWATARLLEGWGCRVLAGASLEDLIPGLAGLERRPDWIISDYRLRGSLTGAEAIARVRASITAAVPAIILSGDCGPEPEHASRRDGHRLLRKPFRPEALLGLLAAAPPLAADLE
jgi:CheY-like chemotaxis protein